MKRKNRRSWLKVFSGFALTLVMTACLTLALNIVFFGWAVCQYIKYEQNYISGGEIMESLMPAETGYVLDSAMQKRLDEGSQWVMLLDEEGQIIWSYHKPDDVKESYSRSDIARMSKWYLEGYPVRMRVWDERIMVLGLPRDRIWKYTVEFPQQLMKSFLIAGILMLFANFVWVLALAVLFTKWWLRNREAARLEWIAGISHDIRTPLAIVMGYSDTLQNSGNLSERQRQQAAVIRRQSVVMKELVEDLNLTSALEYSMQAIHVERIRPAAALREVAAAFLSDAREGELEIAVTVSREAEGVWVLADRKLLVRALRNLIHNSLQHSEQNGTTVIQLRVWEDKKWCCISFSDNGVGYSPEMLRQLGSSKKKRASQNIRGLGIVRKAVLAHGGRIRFENNREGGSFCEIRLKAFDGTKQGRISHVWSRQGKSTKS